MYLRLCLVQYNCTLNCDWFKILYLELLLVQYNCTLNCDLFNIIVPRPEIIGWLNITIPRTMIGSKNLYPEL